MDITEVRDELERALAQCLTFAKSQDSYEGRKAVHDTISLLRRELASLLKQSAA